MRDLLRTGWISSASAREYSARRPDPATHGRVRRALEAVRARREERREIDHKDEFKRRLISIHIASATISRGSTR